MTARLLDNGRPHRLASVPDGPQLVETPMVIRASRFERQRFRFFALRSLTVRTDDFLLGTAAIVFTRVPRTR